MKLRMVLDIKKSHYYEELERIRAIDAKEYEKIGAAFFDAYKDTIDYEGEDLDDAMSEVKKVFSNGYGKYSGEFSGMIEKNGDIAAILFAVHEDNKIFIPYMITIKKESGKGLATSLLKHCINKALQTGIYFIELYVTDGNDRAQRLYERMGFKYKADL